MRDLENAKRVLAEGGYTCVLCKDEDVCTFTLRGVKPLVQLLREGKPFCGYAAADKVVGKATAFLYVLLGVKSVYARVMSESAREVLLSAGIRVEIATLAAHIINRAGDGICPFEAAVLEISEAQTAYSAILAKMKAMGIE